MELYPVEWIQSATLDDLTYQMQEMITAYARRGFILVTTTPFDDDDLYTVILCFRFR